MGVLAVSIAFLGAFLSLPHGTAPDDVPLPRVDRAIQLRTAERRAALAARTVREGLAYEVRAVGDAVRRFGAASAASDGARVEAVLFDVRRNVSLALAEKGPEPLETLRALQTTLFVAAVGEWRREGVVSRDLAELGGTFVEHATSFGWAAANRRLVVDDDELAVAFSIRWTQLCGLAAEARLMPTLTDWRVYFHARLRHPEVGPRAAEDDRVQVLRGYVAALAQRDPEYPLALATGVLDFRVRRYAEAAAAFRAHLKAHPSGRWHLRARNHLAAALERAAGF